MLVYLFTVLTSTYCSRMRLALLATKIASHEEKYSYPVILLSHMGINGILILMEGAGNVDTGSLKFKGRLE